MEKRSRCESILEIRTPHRLPAVYTLPVLLGVVLIKVVLSRYVGAVGKDIESTALNADAWHHVSDAMTSGFAFIGITVGLLTGNPAADDWAALCASPIILFNALRQIRAPAAELLDTAPMWRESRDWRSALSARWVFVTT